MCSVIERRYHGTNSLDGNIAGHCLLQDREFVQIFAVFNIIILMHMKRKGIPWILPNVLSFPLWCSASSILHVQEQVKVHTKWFLQAEQGITFKWIEWSCQSIMVSHMHCIWWITFHLGIGKVKEALYSGQCCEQMLHFRRHFPEVDKFDADNWVSGAGIVQCKLNSRSSWSHGGLTSYVIFFEQHQH